MEHDVERGRLLSHARQISAVDGAVPLAAERALLEAAYRLANTARHMLHENKATSAYVREHANELCQKAADARTACEQEAAHLMGGGGE